jgi:hypothetical protein
MEEVEEQIKCREVVAKVRKQRSDIGQSRGGKRKTSGKENARPSKKTKRTHTQLPPKSKAIISDSESDEDEEGWEHDGVEST